MKPDPDFEDFERDYVRLARQECAVPSALCYPLK